MTPGQFKRLRRTVVACLVLLGFLVMGGGLLEDYRSCKRSEPTRQLSVKRAAQLQAAWYADADRAAAYALIDPDPAGRQVNEDFAAARRALADSVEAAPAIDCGSFPAGV